MTLSDALWSRIADCLPAARSYPAGGRPRVSDRLIFEAILYTMQHGGPWRDLPEQYPPFQTCHRRFQEWRRQGVFDRIHDRLASELMQTYRINLAHAATRRQTKSRAAPAR